MAYYLQSKKVKFLRTYTPNIFQIDVRIFYMGQTYMEYCTEMTFVQGLPLIVFHVQWKLF